MSKYDYDIGILGGGSGGLTVAAGAAQFGAKTLLVEKEKDLGGDCLHYGCVPSKTLIRTAHVYHLLKNAPRYGLPAVEVHPVDFRNVVQRIEAVISAIQKHDSSERFCNLGVRVEFGNARFTDENTVFLNGSNYSARQWVIATGSSPANAPIPGLDVTPTLTNREIFYQDKLPRSMIILGGGPIGIEMGQAFCRLGTEIHIIDVAEQILNREDKDMTDIVMNVMQAEGVRFSLNASVLGIRDLGYEKEAIIKVGQETKNLRAEVILVALGREANLAGMGLEGIGVEFDSKGLKLDSRLRTKAHSHIYGVGDVTGGYQFTHAAGYEAGIAIANAIFRLPRKVNYTYLPWCTYTDPELASIGMNEKAARAAGIKNSVWTEYFRDNDRSLAEGEEEGKVKMLLDENERPIGIQILGPSAGNLISEWVATLNGGTKLSTLASSVHPYPTLAEINKRVAGDFIATKLFSDTVKKGLKFFFNLRGRACEGS
jgi:pyruvate/2-oxoglutarate dehydrogenase complex dihydrolipoamide dehydrogenase (E3) component